MLNTPQLTLTIAPDTRYISTATAAITELARNSGFSDQDATAISLALEEALVNAIQFGLGDDEDRLSLEARFSAMGLKLEVTAHCLHLDQEQLPQYDPKRAALQGDVSGLGLLLMREMMDRVHFGFRGDTRITTMVKRLPAEPLQPETKPLPAPATKAAAQVHARSMRPEEAEDVARLAFRSHGTVFFSEHIYYPDRIRDMNATGELLSTVLVTDDELPVGHGALLFYAPGAMSAEMTYAFIDPAYRRSGGASMLMHHILDKAATAGLSAAYALAVTSHPYSQRPLVHEGFGECVLFLETTPATNQWHRMDTGETARIANIGLIKYLVPPSEAPLHLPPRHRGMIERIYANMGRKHVFATEPAAMAPLPESPAAMEIMTDFTEGWSTIEIDKLGADVVARAQNHIEEVADKGIYAVQLGLPLEDAAAPGATELLEAIGFFFAGTICGNSGEELMLMQYLPGERTDYEALNVQTDFARELVEYVQSCDPRES